MIGRLAVSIVSLAFLLVDCGFYRKSLHFLPLHFFYFYQKIIFLKTIWPNKSFFCE